MRCRWYIIYCIWIKISTQIVETCSFYNTIQYLYSLQVRPYKNSDKKNVQLLPINNDPVTNKKTKYKYGQEVQIHQFNKTVNETL